MCIVALRATQTERPGDLSERGDTSGEDAEVMNAEAGHRALVEAMHSVQLTN
jgi:hypothetical protein